jgi:hypothetical protein
MDLKQILSNVWYYYNYIPTKLAQFLTSSIFKLAKIILNLFETLPLNQQTYLTQILSYADILLGLFFTFFLFVLVGSRKRTATLFDIFLTCFWIALLGLIILFFGYQIINCQYNSFLKGAINNDFLVTFPLEFWKSFTVKDLEMYFKSLDSIGCFFYCGYIFFDTLFAMSTTIFHRQMFSITASKSNNGFLNFFAQKFCFFNLDYQLSLPLLICIATRLFQQ